MTPSLRVKICGITNPDDALTAIDAGADALGFNLYPGSKRHVTLDALSPWLGSLPAGPLRVAVMVNPSLDEIRSAQRTFDVVQLHGQETPALCAAATSTGPIWKALPLAPDLDATQYDSAAAILIDSFVPGAFGGTGSLIDLDRAATFIRSSAPRSIWLSGGLDPANVARAVRTVSPFGVDVASGVEVPGDPRRKDPSRMRDFIAAARDAGCVR